MKDSVLEKINAIVEKAKDAKSKKLNSVSRNSLAETIKLRNRQIP